MLATSPFQALNANALLRDAAAMPAAAVAPMTTRMVGNRVDNEVNQQQYRRSMDTENDNGLYRATVLLVLLVLLVVVVVVVVATTKERNEWQECPQQCATSFAHRRCSCHISVASWLVVGV
jgi:hypothetical protein